MPIENADSVSDIEIYVGGSIVWLIVYICCRWLYKNKSDIQIAKYIIFKSLVSLSPFLITLALRFLIDIEKYYDTVIIIAITCGMCGYIHNLFEIKENNDKKFQEVNGNLKSLEATLEKTNKDYKNILCNPAYAFKANEKFSEELQNESYRVTKRYYEKLDTLEARLCGKFPDSATTVDQTVDQEISKLLLSIASEKAISALDQFGRGKIFLRRELFKDFWESAVKSSSSYLSICDLSMYSGKGDSEIKSEKLNWERRTKKEIEALKGKGKLKFDKIILFDSGQNGQNGSNNIIFNVVADLWENSVQELKGFGIKSHCQSGNGNCMIWKFSCEDFSSCLMHINSSDIKGRINSNDLGIFGDHLIGEEFKVNEVLTTTGELENDGLNELKFLYRFSIQKALVEEIRDMAIKKMNAHCQSAQI